MLATALTFWTALLSAVWVAEPLYSGHAVDVMMTITQGATVDWVSLIGWWIAIFCTLSITEACGKYCEWKFSMQIELEGVERNYDHALKLGMPFHTTQRSGETMKIIGDGAEYASQLSRNIIDIIPSFVAGFAFLCISVTIDWRLALVLMGMVILIITIMVLGTVKTAAKQHKINWLWTLPSGRAMDAFANITSVKSAAQEARELSTMQTQHADLLAKQLKINRLWATLEGIPFFMLTRVLLIGISVVLLAQGEITLGQLYFFQASFFRVLTPFEMLSNILPQWNKSIGKVMMAEKLHALAKEPGVVTPGIIPSSFAGRITFENVSFSYLADAPSQGIRPVEDEPELHKEEVDAEGREHVSEPPAHGSTIPGDKKEDDAAKPDATLDRISMEIKPGEHIALVGESGAGKSTIALLLNRFYDVTDGRILIDGIDIREIDVQWWRGQIGLVLQENLMFNDTVLENIRYARPSATREEVEAATKRASADSFINKLPQKFDSQIGERGVKLSGGQRQRLAIARAILKNPNIVILDEATSALDSITEREVQEGIKELIEKRTAIIIAHRLSTVRSVDRIAVMDKGKLIALAPHEELLKTCDIYRKMVELQSGGLLCEENAA